MLNKELKDLIGEIVKSKKIKTLDDLTDLIKESTKEFLEQALKFELDSTLGYNKYDHETEIKKNYRNGYYNKTLKTANGIITLKIPRDRKGEFNPQIIEKYQTNISDVEKKVISLYARGDSTREISDFISQIYGFDIDTSTISVITDKLLPRITEWNNKPLEDFYPVAFIEGIKFNVRKDRTVEEKTIYVVISYDKLGNKDVLGFFPSEPDELKFWITVLNKLRERGLNDILIIYHNDLNYLDEAISKVFPESIIQKSIVHLIRNCLKIIGYYHLEEFSADMKSIYSASSLEKANLALEKFEKKWTPIYKHTVEIWKSNQEALKTFFNLPKDLRKMIYTSSVIEDINESVWKISRNKNSYPTESALEKVVYLAIKNQLKKWNLQVTYWDSIYKELFNSYHDRIDRKKTKNGK